MEEPGIIVKEKRNKGNIKISLYISYLKAMKGLSFFGPLILLFLFLMAIVDSGFRYIVSLWVDKCISLQNCTDNYALTHFLRSWLHAAQPFQLMFFFFLFCLVAIIIRAFGWIFLIGFLSNGARILHNEMVDSFSNVRITFFDENPTGRLIRRFSGDYVQLKDEMPNIFTDILSSLIEIFIIILIVLTQAPIVIVTVIPCGLFYYRMQSVFKKSMREMQRYTKVLETPIWSMFTETVIGYQTIRAYGKVDSFYQHLLRISQDYAKSVLLQSRFTRWLNFRLKLISESFSLCVTLFVVFLIVQGKIGVGQAGFIMSLTLGLDALMQWFTRSMSLIDAKMVSVERVVEYKELPSEHNSFKVSLVPISENWPKNGEIVFENVLASYRKDLPIILNDLNLHLPAGKKIGIIGRTGAGKSSIFQALFRMVYFHSGKIFVDGLDICTIPLEKARDIFAIVPQDPHLFSGSIRYNLDRAGVYSEEQMWNALKEVQLLNYVDNLPGKLNYLLTERGNNFSVGQKQLLCLARAILKNAKIILMDEATASVDLKTEELIQQAMNKVFLDKTLIIIAHRLDTVQKVDYVALLDKGRVLHWGTPHKIIGALEKEIEEHLV